MIINKLSEILLQFQGCFTRKMAFGWFVVVIMGFIIRFDSYGVTSFVRWLGMESTCYMALLAFFRTTSWQTDTLMQRWMQIVVQNCPLIKIDGRFVLVGDGIKVSKEAKKMPGVKKLHQESDNSGKARYITGHHHGVVGILAGWITKKIFCVPLKAELHEGVAKLRELQGKKAPEVNGKKKVSIATLMADMAGKAASSIGKSIIVLDAYFSVGPVFQIIEGKVDKAGKRLAHVITRAKNNVVAFTDTMPQEKKRAGPEYMAKN